MPGLRERILQATDSDTIHKLQSEGEGFVWAAKKTRNSWKNAAERRRRQLKKDKEPVAEKPKDKPESKRPRKRIQKRHHK
jgi:hypothetical protein